MKIGKTKSYFVDKKIASMYRVPIDQGRKGFLRLDMNENPEGLPKDFFDSVIKEITPEFLSIYPEDGVFRKKYANYLGIDASQVLDVDGSVTAIQYVEKVFGEPGKDIVVVTPTFGMYYVNAAMLGMNCISVKYEDDYSFKIENIINSIGPSTTMVFLVNPNMPMGNVYSQEDIERIILRARKFQAMVVIDEAYFYFYNKTSLGFIEKYDNVIIFRTFSKLLSIPALRLGIIISNKEIIHCLSNWQSHFTVNSIALLFGERILDKADTLIPYLTKRALDGRSYIVDSLTKHGYKVLPANGCFVCFKPLHKSAPLIIEELKDKHILIHSADGGVLSGCLRVTTASVNIMKQFLTAFYEIDR